MYALTLFHKFSLVYSVVRAWFHMYSLTVLEVALCPREGVSFPLKKKQNRRSVLGITKAKKYLHIDFEVFLKKFSSKQFQNVFSDAGIPSSN